MKSNRKGERLGHYAFGEYVSKGKITMTCPKCKEVPDIKVNGIGYKNVKIKCSCGYIHLGERSNSICSKHLKNP